MLKIKNERLEVEIAEPGKLYRGARFDWTGFIVQVILDDRHTFCGMEEKCGGRGLCNEFGIIEPIGFDEMLPGEQFPKLGVGLLTRPDNEEYAFGRNYQIEPFDIEYSAMPDSVSFTVFPRDCHGYSAQLEKVVSIKNNSLEIKYTLINTGNKPLHTDEYNHNFLSIDGHEIGLDYKFETSFLLPEENIPRPLSRKNNGISFLETPWRSFYLPVPQVPEVARPCWELIYLPNRLGIMETSFFPLSRFALWGTEKLISPETFFRIEIDPGQQAAWTRSYEFF